MWLRGDWGRLGLGARMAGGLEVLAPPSPGVAAAWFRWDVGVVASCRPAEQRSAELTRLAEQRMRAHLVFWPTPGMAAVTGPTPAWTQPNCAIG